jgi:uncharacterized protein YifN (PemK superfamily)
MATVQDAHELTVEELCAQYGLVKQSRRQRLIGSTPRIGQYFWVDFPHDAYAPEFVGEHPGIVIRAAQRYDDVCTIVPVTSTTPREMKPHIHPLARNPNPDTPTTKAWAICSHVYTIHIARLRPVKDRYGRPVYPKVDRADMEAIFACMRLAFSQVCTVPEKPKAPPPEGEPNG